MKWIFFLLAFVTTAAYSQDDSARYIHLKNTYGQRIPRFTVDSVFGLPLRDTNFTPYRAGVMVVRPANKQPYIHDGVKWNLIAGGGGSSVWGGITGTLASQTDLVTALALKFNNSRISTYSGLGTSNDSVSSQKAVKDYVDALILSSAIPDGDKGDVDVTGGGTVWNIDTSAVGTNELANLSVTNGKINDVDVNKITGITGTPTGFKFLADDRTWKLPPTGVSSFNGRTGAVSPETNDYTWAQIDKTTSSLANLTTRSASDLNSGTLPAARFGPLSGDVTTSGYVATIANGAITDAKVSDVAFSKITGVPAFSMGYTFTVSDFNQSGSTISLDYTNGQKASSTVPGFVLPSDYISWTDKLSNITGYVTASGSIVRTGLGTAASPYNFAYTAPTALSAFTNDAGFITASSTNTLTNKTWNGAAIGDAYISSAATWNAKLSNITSLISAGTNVTISGLGTSGSPYVINATPGGGGSGTVNSGAANTLAYYSASGTVIDDLAAITANRALVSNANGLPVAATTTATEIGYVNGVTSGIQGQLNGKQASITTGTNLQYFRGDLSLATFPTNLSAFSNGPGYITDISGHATASGSIVRTGLGTLASPYNFAYTAPTVLSAFTNDAGFITASSSNTLTNKIWNSAVIGSTYGGAGTTNGILKANGSGVVSAAVAGTDYQVPITVTTTGSSGPATFSGGVLNIPQYSGGGGGGSGTVNSGLANRLAYYAADGTTVDALAGITANRVIVSNSNGLPVAASTTTTQLGYLDATSSIQTQLNTKLENITGKVTAGTNVTITGSGTTAAPYVVNSTGGGGSALVKQTLTDASTTTWDITNGQAADWTIAGNRTLSITNPGTSPFYGVVRITQGTGGNFIPTLPGHSEDVVWRLDQGEVNELKFYFDGSTYHWESDFSMNTTTGNQLSAPENFTVTPLTSTSNSIMWNAVSGATSYRLQRSTSINFRTALTVIYTGSGTSYTNTGLTAGVQYYYRIQALASGAQSSAYAYTEPDLASTLGMKFNGGGAIAILGTTPQEGSLTGGTVLEPSFDVYGDTAVVFYTASASDVEHRIHRAYTLNPDNSSSWVKQGAVIGDGVGGAPSSRVTNSACVIKYGSYTYAFATDGYGFPGDTRSVYLYRSSDNGYTFSDLGEVFATNPGAGIAGYGNTTIWPEQVGGVFYGVTEIWNPSLSIWESVKVSASNIEGPWTVSTTRLSDLQVATNGMYGGGWIERTKDGVWHLFYHYGIQSGNLPTSLAYARSTNNLTNWTIVEAPFKSYFSADGTPPTPPANSNEPYAATDQIADPAILKFKGKTYFGAEYGDNSYALGTAIFQIRTWKYDGIFEQLINTSVSF